MNLFRKVDQYQATAVSFGVRTLLISAEGVSGAVARRLAELGNTLECHNELYAGLEMVIEDPTDYGLIVIECDGLGGLAAGRRVQTLLAVVQKAIPTILISSECKVQNFPDDRRVPTELRAPLSAIAMRVGFEHAMRDRLMMAQAR